MKLETVLGNAVVDYGAYYTSMGMIDHLDNESRPFIYDGKHIYVKMHGGK